MEVILLEDVKTLGKKGDVVKVNDGYARNYVLPKKLGIEATAANRNDLKLKKANDEKIALQKLEDAKAFAKVLEESTVTVKIKTGKDGRTFGSVSSKEITQEAKKQLEFDLDKKKIMLDEPIRTVGTHVIQIRLHKDVIAKLNVKVQEA